MIILLFREISKLAGKSISFAIVLSRMKEDLKVMLGDFLSPSGLPTREKSLRSKGLQVVVIRKYRERSR